MMYELFYLVPTRYTDAEVQGLMEKVAGMVTKAGGKITRNEMLARQKLAYPIKGSHHGVYALAHFEGEPAIVNPLDRQLRLTDELLRHQITLLPTGAADKVYRLMPYAPPLSDEGRPEMPRVMRPAAPSASVSVPAKADEAQMDVETINKKLDEILTEDVSKQA